MNYPRTEAILRKSSRSYHPVEITNEIEVHAKRFYRGEIAKMINQWVLQGLGFPPEKHNPSKDDGEQVYAIKSTRGDKTIVLDGELYYDEAEITVNFLIKNFKNSKFEIDRKINICGKSTNYRCTINNKRCGLETTGECYDKI